MHFMHFVLVGCCLATKFLIIRMGGGLEVINGVPGVTSKKLVTFSRLKSIHPSGSCKHDLQGSIMLTSVSYGILENAE